MIVGWPEREKIIGQVALGLCGHCQNQSPWYLSKARQWATVFFIPVLPLSRKKHYLFCGTCNTPVEIDGENVAAAKEMIETTERFKDEELTESEYVELATEFWQTVHGIDEPTDPVPKQPENLQPA